MSSAQHPKLPDDTTKNPTCMAPPRINGRRIDQEMPLHKLWRRRMEKKRDLKILITAWNNQTGVGKTTLAGWLGLQWNPMYTKRPFTFAANATVSVPEYFQTYPKLPRQSVLVMDEAEQLDARRSVASENVQFSHDWMQQRVRQITSILTLPSIEALDKRLINLADVWIDIRTRGIGWVHLINHNSYDGNTYKPRIHNIKFPDVSDHRELKKLADAKEQMLAEKYEPGGEHQDVDVDKLKKETKQEYRNMVMQKMRDAGFSVTEEIAPMFDLSHAQVYRITEPPEDDTDE